MVTTDADWTALIEAAMNGAPAPEGVIEQISEQIAEPPPSDFWDEEQAAGVDLGRVGHDVRAAAREKLESKGYVAWDAEFWDPPPPVYFVPRMLTEGQVGTIYSAGGLGKSLLSLDVAVGLTIRGSIFGEQVDKQPVLYIDRENSRRGLMGRLRAMGVTEADDLSLLHYSLLGDWSALDRKVGGEELLAEARRVGARLIVLDTMSKMVDGEENSNDTWKGLHSHTMVAIKRAGITVLQLDHTGKDADKGQRGGSSKHDNADVVWHLTVAGEFVRLDRKKDRDDNYDPVLTLERVAGPLAHVYADTLPAAAAAFGPARRTTVADVVEILDTLDLPLTVGRDKCRAAIKEAYPGLGVNNTVLGDALKQRREPVQDLSSGLPAEGSAQPDQQPVQT